MGTEDVRERDLAPLRDVVASLRAPICDVTPSPWAGACWGVPTSLLSRDPSGPGVRWASLELLRDLLRVDGLCLHAMDTARRQHFFVQEVTHDGPDDLFVQAEGPGGPIDPTVELDDELTEADARFWDGYWSSTCSFPDRTGDWDTAICSGLAGRREVEEWCRRMDRPLEVHLFAATSIGRSRQLRILGWRDGWSTYSERVRGCLELLKPHVVDAWRRSCVTSTPLTAAQRRVLGLVREGHTNQMVARDLGISEATVRTHLQNAYSALGVTNRVAAVAAAVAAAFGSADAVVPTQPRGGAG